MTSNCFESTEGYELGWLEGLAVDPRTLNVPRARWDFNATAATWDRRAGWDIHTLRRLGNPASLTQVIEVCEGSRAPRRKVHLALLVGDNFVGSALLPPVV